MVGGGKPPAAGQAPAGSPVQAGFGAGSRHFKKAVDRNRIKRLCREAYRLQKLPLLDLLKKKERSLAVFFIYTGKELPDYRTVSDKIGVLLQKLMKEFE
jgi:ribonuclease P protein component